MLAMIDVALESRRCNSSRLEVVNLSFVKYEWLINATVLGRA